MSRLAWREVSNTPRQSRGMATSVARPFEAEVAALNLANGLAVQPEHYALYVVRLEIFA